MKEMRGGKKENEEEGRLYQMTATSCFLFFCSLALPIFLFQQPWRRSSWWWCCQHPSSCPLLFHSSRKDSGILVKTLMSEIWWRWWWRTRRKVQGLRMSFRPRCQRVHSDACVTWRWCSALISVSITALIDFSSHLWSVFPSLYTLANLSLVICHTSQYKNIPFSTVKCIWRAMPPR